VSRIKPQVRTQVGLQPEWFSPNNRASTSSDPVSDPEVRSTRQGSVSSRRYSPQTRTITVETGF